MQRKQFTLQRPSRDNPTAVELAMVMDNKQRCTIVWEPVVMLKKMSFEDNKIIFRRGQVSNDADGTPLLINGRGEGYRVNDTAVYLWNLCNGITFSELLSEVLRISSDKEEEVRKSLAEMVKQLRKISVLEVKERRV